MELWCYEYRKPHFWLRHEDWVGGETYSTLGETVRSGSFSLTYPFEETLDKRLKLADNELLTW